MTPTATSTAPQPTSLPFDPTTTDSNAQSQSSPTSPKRSHETPRLLAAFSPIPSILQSALGTRPSAPSLQSGLSQSARRLTIQDSSTPALSTPSSPTRPTTSRPLLGKNLQYKSSSAIPTLTSTSVASQRTSGTTTPVRRHTGLASKSSPSSRRASMAGHDGHSAADLLRQSLMNTQQARQTEDDMHDHPGSNGSTPPGAATPRPDLHADKRLPGIMNSYFGQNTPPQTPRNSSQDGRTSTSHPTTLTSLSTQTPTSTKSNEPTVGPIIGKLTVDVTEGRGLRASVDPYVVVQFQWSENISSGPARDESSGTGLMPNGLAKLNGAGSIPMRRSDSSSRPQAIPMSSRTSSHSGRDGRPSMDQVTDPRWDHKAIFDITSEHAELDVSVYDRANQEAFLGHVRLCPHLVEKEKPFDAWLRLEPREGEEQGQITGEINLRIQFQKTEKKHYGPEDFQILKLIGKGTFGQVFQVRKKDTGAIYAMKVLSKKVIVQKKEVAHTLGERNILVRTATTESPFIVGLKFSFQTAADLYFVTDYMSGGELFWHLQKEGRFQEERAKFYIAELILALQHLHENDIVYRDLKPENILLDANGHIALCDFGLSKANLADSDTTNTFCGTTEYLAPEVLLDEHGYTKMVDFWSLGVLVFEMCCGWSPFYAEDTQQMYKNIAFGKVRFPRDALSTEGRNFVKGLLNRNPKHRLGAQGDAQELKQHPFFEDIDWDALGKKNVIPPFKPKLKSKLDVSNFDPEFTNALNNGAGSLNARAQALASGVNPASTPLSPTVQANFKGFTFVDESAMEREFADRVDDDRMDEDDDDSMDKSFSERKGDRMSGILGGNNNDREETVFNHAGFDV